MITEEQVRENLMDVLDPEIKIDIVNMGMVYGIDIDEEKKHVKITMTLTTMGCPAFEGIRQQVIEAVKKAGDVETVDVNLVFDPPWNKEMMSEEAKLAMRYMF
ncbi:metal-sulfur cluster assembly factor [Fodinisporobacter ferrooxydans]|uniref:Metal-sulfur cluster assembly factor n=1 Tax=Fodinisporobacter ferrooxydans TaxID=2901836 RepID=A0ABY4CM95_9BACL|nr:metal-sulfur cluster assembly factor [Alicyclobacillaceae bacterium MYW30-H2]